MYKRVARLVRARMLCLLALAAGVLAAVSARAQWVAFNDHVPGASTAARATGYTLTQSAGVGQPTGGPLTNFNTGQAVPAGVAITTSGYVNGTTGSSTNPAAGTPADLLFNGIVSWGASAIYFGTAPYAGSVTLTFTNLSPGRKYSFRGLAHRGGTYPGRWTLVTLAGAAGAAAAHQQGIGSPGIVTNGYAPYGDSLQPGCQAAVNSGANLCGDVVGWDQIVPMGSSFSVICSNYHCLVASGAAVPGGTIEDNYSYGINAFKLEEFEPEAIIPAAIVTPPAGGGVTVGQAFTLSVGATGYPLRYQWRKSGVPISGATNWTCTIATTSTNDSGYYSVMVSGATNSIASASVLLTVYPDYSQPLVSLTGSTWRYNQSGEDLGTNWSQPGYDDSGWPAGRGVFAQEDNPAVTPLTNTILSLSNELGTRVITYYFRTQFLATNLSADSYLTLSNLIDDGCVVWLNGKELYRINLTNGPVGATWFASLASEGVFIVTNLTASGLLAPGTNTLAVEVHQNNATSSDVAMGVALKTCSWTNGPVVIVQPPRNQAVYPGASAAFSVLASGQGPLSYQWRKNGINIPGATKADYSVPSVAGADDGTYYDVVVANAGSSATSPGAVLAVLPMPTISGAVWQDLNRNGVWERQLVSGTLPDIAFVVDNSSSTTNSFQGAPVGDVNGDGLANTILDAELAGLIALNQNLINHGLSNLARIAVIPFASNAVALDLDPVASGAQTFARPAADTDSNGTSDIEQIARSIRHSVNTDYHLALVTARAVLAGATETNRTRNLVFISDGEPNKSPYAADVEALAADGVHLRAFGAGTGANLSTLQVIDASAQIFTSTDELTTLFGNPTNTFEAGEPGMAGVTVYLDTNTNGVRDAGEPSVVSGASGQFNFTNLTFGTYLVRQVAPGGFVQTFPTNYQGQAAVVSSNLSSAGSVFGNTLVTVADLPDITLKPQSRTNIAGTTADFTVAATSPSPLTYQWRFAATNLPNQTNALLSIPNVQLVNAGAYDVVVANAAGSVTSLVASLTVWVKPVITLQPQSRTNSAGTTADFTVAATSAAPLTYQWRFAATNLPNQTNALLSIPNVQLVNAGAYDVVVANAAGSVTSLVASLTVWVKPVITLQPQSRTNSAGTTADFTVAATSAAPLTYQWRFAATNLLNQTNALLSIPNVQAVNAGAYDVVVANAAGSVTSLVASLTVWVKPVITLHPQSRTNIAGTTADFAVAATSAAPLTYQWRLASANLPNQTNALLSIPNVQAVNAGAYDVVVANAAGSVTSLVASLTVWVKPVITLQPQSRTNIAGTTADFTVAATSVLPLTYQWRFASANLPSQTNALLSITNVQAVNAGAYDVVVANAAGSVTSLVAELSVAAMPSISGAVWQDLNRNGIWERQLVSGSLPDIAFVVDNSSSTSNAFQGAPVGDVNGDGLANTILDAELAGLIALNQNLIRHGLSNLARIAVIPFASNAAALDLDPVAAGTQTFASPAADTDASGASDIEQAARSIRHSFGTDYHSALVTARAVLAGSLDTNRTRNLVFISDGEPNNAPYAADVAALQADGVHLRAFGAGTGAKLSALQVIDSSGQIFTSADELITLFGSLTNTFEPGEPGMAGVTVYLDANTNGVRDAGEASTVSGAGGEFLFTNLAFGTYVVRQVVPAGFAQTYPTNNQGQLTAVTTNLSSAGAVFGNATAIPDDLPSITAQPQNQTVPVGSTASFSATASGTAPLQYQWLFNHSVLQGQTARTLVLANAQFGQAGEYAVQVKNAAGSVESAGAVLRVVAPSNTVVFVAGNATNQAGLEAVVPLDVYGFQRVSVFQFSLHWDPAVALLAGVEQFNLPGLGAVNFATNPAAAGTLTVSWEDLSGGSQSLADATSICKLRFRLIGSPGSVSPVTINGSPTPVEVAGEDYSLFSTLLVPGSLRVAGAALAGMVRYYDGVKGVPGVTVELTGPPNATGVSASSGAFEVAAPPNTIFTVAAAKTSDDPLLNGVSTLDIGLIRRHVLNQVWLDSPYKLLAADVNGSQSISTLDIFQIRRLVLGLTNTLPSGLWLMVRADHVFADPLNPWNPPGSRRYTNVTADLSGQDFTAVKLGDVNNSWTAPAGGAAAKSGAAPKGASDLAISAGRATAQTGGSVTVPVQVTGFDHVTTLQASLAWDPAVLRFNGVGDFTLSGLAPASFNTSAAASGTLTFSWDDPSGLGQALTNGAALFSLQFTVLGASGSQSAVSFVDAPTPREASVGYVSVLTNWQEGGVSVTASGGPVLLGITGSGASLTLNVQGPTGARYVIESADVLSGTNTWKLVTTVTLESPSQPVSLSTETNRSQQFYRARPAP